MKKVIHTEYGPPSLLHFAEVEKPAPKDDEVLVKIHAASLNAYDWHLLTADIFLVRFETGLFKPKGTRIGADIAGRVEAVGKNVTQFKSGDEVYADLASCGGGGFAEYVTVPENYLAFKPANFSFEESAAVPMAAVTALQGLRDEGKIQAGHKVLINGASGGVGTYAVQLAKHFGAKVTAVCSTRNVEMVRSLGADHVIDYTQENFTEGDEKYDLILGVNGYHPLSAYKRTLTSEGRYVMAGGTSKQIFSAVLFGALISTKGKKMSIVSAKPNQKDLDFMRELLEANKVKSIIDKVFKVDVIAQALAYIGEGHARGKVVITME
ncbi:MAG: NAD(P)-dependent alcohol dehydrogenase [Anaerolineae bacterium]|nr:NAD(P)-dependent alcohol dehydrogenase [Anaerolineae bacterium]MBT3714366.1 NAD(P)-dependent alcohol dehydrogenase [Anaerolineae bacterium]MBT4309532.1 NAD(P)-dependent alcohol dehydrogenase [Anaerolineae bacterium]MBT4458393.1 NAD(P)-dependent alcohol dehydrogenase [Anaerolineae bacterium]MBT4841228.1 NAD(P)-dependent alcohol dehydrogenase [Anaerolineae bacterium]